MADKQKVFVSGPGAVRGKAPVVTKTVPVKSSTSKSKVSNANIEAAKALGNVSKDIGKLGGLLATYLGGGATETAVTPVTPAPTTSTTDDALLQAILAGQQTAAAQAAAQAQAERQSAYDILLSEFTRYGLSALVEPLKGFIISGASPAELTIQLQNTDAYKKRFAANEQRIAKGLAALSPAEYVEEVAQLRKQIEETAAAHIIEKAKVKKDSTFRSSAVNWGNATPFWMQNQEQLKRVLDSHKANLYRKDPLYYAEYRNSVAKPCCDRCLYYWPTHVGILV